MSNTNAQAERLIEAFEAMRQRAEAEGQRPKWPPPPAAGWAHIPVVLHDLVWNLGRNYDTVAGPIIKRYTDHVAETRPDDSKRLRYGHEASLAHDWDHYTTREGLAMLEELGPDGRRRIASNNSPAHSKPGAPRRADTIVDLHRAFVGVGIDTVPGARDAWTDGPKRQTTAAAIRSVPGLDGAAVDYFPQLIGLESIKPDRHVIKWFKRIGISLGIRETAVAAVSILNDRDGGGWTVAGVDHAIWRDQSGRPLI